MIRFPNSLRRHKHIVRMYIGLISSMFRFNAGKIFSNQFARLFLTFEEDGGRRPVLTIKTMQTNQTNLIEPITSKLMEFNDRRVASVASSATRTNGLKATMFLTTCERFSPILDCLGMAFKPAKADVNGNIERIQKASEASDDDDIYEVVREEKKRNESNDSRSTAKALLWLKRFLEFVIELLREITDDSEKELRDAAVSAYERTLKPFHGWVSAAAFSVVLKFPPTRASFVASIGGEDVVKTSAVVLVEKFSPLLEEIDSFLTEEGLNDPTKV
jgi:hypothetical protein